MLNITRRRRTVTTVVGEPGTAARRAIPWRRQLRTLSRSRRRRVAYLERLPAGLHGAGRQLRALSRSGRRPAPMVWLLSQADAGLTPTPCVTPEFLPRNFARRR